jgi:tellurite resistance protein TerC
MEAPLSFWFGFNLAVVVLLLLDLTVLNRKGRAPSMKESVVTTLVWVALACGFGAWLIVREGAGKGSEFFIGAGTALLEKFNWLSYLFGAYIVYAGVSMLFHQPEADVEKMRIVWTARKILPLAAGDHGNRFITRENGRLSFTLLFLVLLVVEITDLIFALDSIPAIFGVTRDPFIVYTSNVCAVLGLRSLYFVLAGLVKSLVYLHIGLACSGKTRERA